MGKLCACALFALILVGCHSKHIEEIPMTSNIHSEELSRIVINFSTKMKIDKHLELEDSSVFYDDSVLKISVQYSSTRLLTVYDARLLIVEVVDELLWRLNNNNIVKRELAHFPFTAADLDVKITFENYYGIHIDDLYVGTLWLQDGLVYYYAFDCRDSTYLGIDWEHHRLEPYYKSRELALIKKEADLPYVEQIPNPNLPRSAYRGSSDRYRNVD